MFNIVDNPQLNKERLNGQTNDVVNNATVLEEDVESKEIIVKRLITFELDNQTYAVDIKCLKEVTRIGEITPVPNSPDFIKGILSLRGEFVLIIDLEKKFNLIRESQNPQTYLLVLENDKSMYGVIVDAVSKVITINESDIQSASELESKINTKYIKGIIVFDNEKAAQNEEGIKKGKDSRELVIYLDLTKILLDEEILSINSKEIVLNK